MIKINISGVTSVVEFPEVNEMKPRSLKNQKESIRLFLILFVSYALIYMTKNCYSAAMASIVNSGVMTKSQTGLISAVFYLVYAPFQIIGGIASDKCRPHKILLFGFMGAGICNLLVFFVESYVGMIIIWSVNAVCQFGVWPSIFKLVSSELCEEHRLRGIFYINFTVATGQLISYIISIYISNWKYNFLISAFALFFTFFYFLIGYTRVSRYMTEDEPRVTFSDSKNEVEKLKRGEFLSLLIKAGIPVMLIVGAAQSMINLGVKTLAPTMLMESYENITPALANALNIILVLASPLGYIIARSPIFKKACEPAVVAILLFTTIPSLFVITRVGKLSVAVVVIALAFLMISVAGIGMLFSYIGKKFDKYSCSATIIGLFNCMASLGVVIANYVFARMADDYGWGITTNCWFAIMIVMFALMLFIIPVYKKFEKKYLRQ